MLSSKDMLKILQNNNKKSSSAPASSPNTTQKKQTSQTTSSTPKSTSSQPKQTVTVTQTIPSLEPAQTTANTVVPSAFESDEELLNYFNSLPEYNVFERAFNKDKRNVYNEKQSLAKEAENASARVTKKGLQNAGLTDDEVKHYLEWQWLGGDIQGYDEYGNPYDKADPVYDKVANKIKELGYKDIDVVNAYENGTLNATYPEGGKSIKETPFTSSLMATALKPAESLVQLGGNAVNYVLGKPLEQLPSMSQDIRNTVSEDWNGIGKGAYDLANTTADMLFARGIGGGLGGTTKAASNIAAGVMGAEKASDVTNSAIDRGLNPTQTMAEGIASGVTTALTEKIPLGKLDEIAEGGLTREGGKLLKKEIAKYIGSVMVSEGLQEMSEDVADLAADYIIGDLWGKGKSEISTNVRNLEANGMSHEEALKQVWGDWLKNTAIDGLMGALSGGLLGGGEVALQALGGNVRNVESIADQTEQNVLEDAELENAIAEALSEEGESIPSLEEITSEIVNNPVEDNILNEDFTNENVKNEVPGFEESLNEAISEPSISTNENVNEEFTNPNVNNEDFGFPNRSFIDSLYLTDEMLNHNRPETLPDIPRIQADASAPNASGETTAQTSTNTFKNSATFNRTQETLDYLQNAQQKGMHKVDVVSERTSLENAAKALENDYNGEVDRLANTNDFSGQDTDESMMILDDYVQEAIDTGDFSKVDSWTRKIINKVHKAAQGLQALAKYSRTASSMIVKTAKMIETVVDNADSKTKTTSDRTANKIIDSIQQNTEVGKTATDLATDIVNSVNDERPKTNRKADSALKNVRPYNPNNKASKSKLKQKSHEQIVAEVTQSIEMEKASNKMLEDFTDADIEELATRVENGDSTREIANALMKRLTYGDWNYEETVEPTTTNGRVDSALARLGYDGSYTEEERTQIHQEIVDDIRRSLEKESNSVFKDFTDEDIEYLARLVESGESAQTIADKITQRLETGLWGFSQEDLKRITDIYKQIDELNPNSKEASDLEAEAFEIMSKYLGEGTFMEKWNQFRYLAMLGNPRTHIRNIVGNTLFGAVTNVKDAIGAGLETISGTDDRTKAIVSRTLNPELFKATDADFDNYAYGLAKDDGNKYSMQRGVEAFKKTFHTKLMNKLSNFNNNALENEDMWAIKRKYSRALAGYLKANNLSTDILNGNSEVAQKARAYALNEAKIATFHEDSRLADLLNQISRTARNTGGVGGWFVNTAIESVVPFKKTPINIMKQGVVEYNPLQIAHAIGQSLSNGFNKAQGNDAKFNPSEIINNYAKGLTGSMIMGLGVLLAHMGILRGKGDDDDRFFDEQSYSINVGNKSYTVDWSAPASLPMFVGVELYNWATDNDAKTGKRIWDALGSISDPMIEMSMMSGIRDALKSASYATKNGGSSLGSFLTNLGVNYLSQAVPTLGGQIARTIDDTRRDTYSGEEYGSVSDTVVKNLKKQINKIPGLSNLNQPYVDEWGQEEKNIGYDDIIADILNDTFGMNIDKDEIPAVLDYLGRAAYNMTSPGYYSNTERTEAEAEIERLKSLEDYDKIKEDTKIGEILPSKPSYTYDKERLSPEDYTKYAKEQGRLYKEGYDALVNNEDYLSLSDKDKAYTMNEVRKFMGALAKANARGYDISSSDYKDELDAYNRNGADGLIKHIVNKRTLSNNGIKTSSKLGKQAMASGDAAKYLENEATKIPTLDGGTTYDTKVLTNGTSYVSVKTAVPYLNKTDLSDSERGELLYNTGERGQKEIAAYEKYGYSGVNEYYNIKYYGETTGKSGVARQEIIDYLLGQGADVDTINAWLQIYGLQKPYNG